MQNRFVLRGVPSVIRKNEEAESELMDYIESQTCWVDRFAWIEDSNETLVAVELDLENVRDQAVEYFDGRDILLPLQNLKFVVHAAPATSRQSALLLKQFVKNGKESNSPSTVQTLHLPDSIALRINRSTEGGTGSEAWRGGLFLAQQICQWFGATETENGAGFDEMKKLFCEREVLELGAGSAGLPSLALAAASAKKGRVPPCSVVASDGIDEVVEMLKKNVLENGLLVGVRTIDWNRLPASLLSVDSIMFADCIYTERGGSCFTMQLKLLFGQEGMWSECCQIFE